MLDWPRWVHRRVETVSFEDADTYRRRVSIDFTLPSDLTASPLSSAGEPIYFVPLTLLKKEPLTRFDLRDESGGTLALLTKERNGSLAAALLVEVANALASPQLEAEHGADVPTDLAADLLEIARGAPTSLASVRTQLGGRGDETSASRAWRNALVADPWFPRFTHLLANNFLAVVPLRGPTNVRRVLKLAYDEREEQRHAPPRSPKLLRRLGRWLIRRVSGYNVRPRSTRIRRGGALRRGLALRADVRRISVPAIGFGASYHIEFVAPDGLMITSGSLLPLYRGRPLVNLLHSDRTSRRRMHLYVSGLPERSAPFELDGLAVVHIRPAAETIIRGAALTSLVTTGILVAIALRWEAFVEDVGAVPSLLLIVPAGMAAFVARPREASVTTSLLFGLRLAALSAGLWSFAAAAVLVLGRTCTTVGELELCEGSASTPYLLWALVAASAITAMGLIAAWLFGARPPEQTAGP